MGVRVQRTFHERLRGQRIEFRDKTHKDNLAKLCVKSRKAVGGTGVPSVVSGVAPETFV
jgi:hypothetical protein